MEKFSKDELKLIRYAKKAILKYCKERKKKGLYDKLYGFVLSESGKIYPGSCFESNLTPTNICAETHAVSNMIFAETEKAKIKSILVAGPVPKESERSVMPCGRCRHVINEFGTSKTTVLSSEFIRLDKGWKFFPKIQKYFIKEIYPFPYIPVKWD